MARFSPKIEIINHFDNLINRIDIDIDSSLEKFNNQQLIRDLFTSSENDRWKFRKSYDFLNVEIYNSSKQNLDSWPESMKVVDYLKQIRMKTIEELKKAQEEKLESYKLNSERFKSELNKEKNIEELRSQLFAEKFYFQIHFFQTKKRLWAFSLFTFATDFYMSPSDINTLEYDIYHNIIFIYKF